VITTTLLLTMGFYRVYADYRPVKRELSCSIVTSQYSV